MQKAEIVDVIIPETSKKVFLCPDCKKPWNSSYHHVKPGGNFGPWYCEHCGCGVRGTVTADGADIETTDEKKAITNVLLRLCTKQDQMTIDMDEPIFDENVKPIYIIVEHMMFYPRGAKPEDYLEERQGLDRYRYNEGTCPWNYLQLPIRFGEDTDPHGIFAHVETILKPEGAEEAAWEMFKTFQTTDQPSPQEDQNPSL